MDRRLGIGVTVDEYIGINGKHFLSTTYRDASTRKMESNITECDCDDIDVLGKDFLLYGENVAKLDDYGYSVMGKFLGIPVPYLLKLSIELRNANCQYWLEQKSGKQVKVQIKDNQLLDMTAADAIDPVDVLKILNDVYSGAIILNTVQQTNSTVFDLYLPDEEYEAGGRTFYGGVRCVLKSGLNAPDIVPIFVDSESCSIIECATFVSESSIRGLSYVDILRVIRSTAGVMRSALDGLFHTYEHLSEEVVTEPRRRIALYAREHGLPDRVASYVLKQYDDAHIADVTYGDIIALFGGMGFVDEVKQASERKMQKLAGYILVKAHGERRCASCDSRLLEE